MSSDNSLLGGIPPASMLRRSTSAPIITVMKRSRMPAAVIMPSNRRPYHRDRMSIHAFAVTALSGLLKEVLELRSGHGALPDDAVPAGLVRLRKIHIRHRPLERDGLDASGGLTLIS